MVSNESLARQIMKYRPLQDTPALNLLQQRQIFIKYCILSELSLLHKMQANISVMYSNYVKDEFIYAKQWTDHWNQLQPFINQLPNTYNDFL